MHPSLWLPAWFIVSHLSILSSTTRFAGGAIPPTGSLSNNVSRVIGICFNVGVGWGAKPRPLRSKDSRGWGQTARIDVPFYGVSVEEGPGRDNEDEDGGGAAEAEVHGELDVLEEITDEEGNGLETDSY